MRHPSSSPRSEEEEILGRKAGVKRQGWRIGEEVTVVSRKRTDDTVNKAESEGWGTGDGLETLLGENREERLVVGKGRGIGGNVRAFCFCKAGATYKLT